MDRITNAKLEGLVKLINKATASPPEPYVKDEGGKLRPQGGNYHLDFAYGGVSLSRMCATGSGVDSVLDCGYTTKRDLYNRMRAYLDGIGAGKVAKQEEFHVR